MIKVVEHFNLPPVKNIVLTLKGVCSKELDITMSFDASGWTGYITITKVKKGVKSEGNIGKVGRRRVVNNKDY